MQLNEIKDNKGATNNKKRVGRGIASGLGKTAGRGHKGQRARNTVRPGFEGGQTVIYRRMPKRGFVNPFSNNYYPLNLEQLNNILTKHSLKEDTQIDFSLLKQLRVIKGNYNGIALLGQGEITTSVNIKANKISKSAKIKLEKLNSKFEIIANNKVNTKNSKN